MSPDRRGRPGRRRGARRLGPLRLALSAGLLATAAHAGDPDVVSVGAGWARRFVVDPAVDCGSEFTWELADSDYPVATIEAIEGPLALEFAAQGLPFFRQALPLRLRGENLGEVLLTVQVRGRDLAQQVPGPCDHFLLLPVLLRVESVAGSAADHARFAAPRFRVYLREALEERVEDLEAELAAILKDFADGLGYPDGVVPSLPGDTDGVLLTEPVERAIDALLAAQRDALADHHRLRRGLRTVGELRRLQDGGAPLDLPPALHDGSGLALDQAQRAMTLQLHNALAAMHEQVGAFVASLERGLHWKGQPPLRLLVTAPDLRPSASVGPGAGSVAPLDAQPVLPLQILSCWSEVRADGSARLTVTGLAQPGLGQVELALSGSQDANAVAQVSVRLDGRLQQAFEDLPAPGQVLLTARYASGEAGRAQALAALPSPLAPPAGTLAAGLELPLLRRALALVAASARRQAAHDLRPALRAAQVAQREVLEQVQQGLRTPTEALEQGVSAAVGAQAAVSAAARAAQALAAARIAERLTGAGAEGESLPRPFQEGGFGAWDVQQALTERWSGARAAGVERDLRRFLARLAAAAGGAAPLGAVHGRPVLPLEPAPTPGLLLPPTGQPDVLQLLTVAGGVLDGGVRIVGGGLADAALGTEVRVVATDGDGSAWQTAVPVDDDGAFHFALLLPEGARRLRLSVRYVAGTPADLDERVLFVPADG